MGLRFLALSVAACLLADGHHAAWAQDNWRDPQNMAILRNDSMRLELQAGIPTHLVDLHTGNVLLDAAVDQLPQHLAVFGARRVDLNTCRVTQHADATEATTTYHHPDGSQWTLRWRVEPGQGDMVLNAEARTIEPVDEFRILLFGCDISNHTLVYVHAYGVGHTSNAPWTGTFLGDPNQDGSPGGFPHPLVALFQGDTSGWFIEGRDERIGPSNVLIKGVGDAAHLGFNRRYPIPTRTPELFEVRIRTYEKHWEDAVDPYVNWLEHGAGFVALDNLPPEQRWIADLKTQAYIPVGNYKELDNLAGRVNPQKTLIGRQGEFRNHAFDIGYPDYRLSPEQKAWVRYARNLGFHVGMHFNSKSVSAMFPELVDRFRPGMAVIGHDEHGNEQYEHIYSGANTLYRVSAGLKDWRNYLIEQIAEAVEAGIDVVYLDETMSPSGKMVVDGVDGFEGLLLLKKELLERYPHVAVKSEQFNTLTGKYSKIALSQMPLGHPLSGYIFHRFIKVVPEGVMYSPTDNDLMDAFDAWGFMLPGSHTYYNESWTRVTEAFHQYDLVPDSRMVRQTIRIFEEHYTHGRFPKMPDDVCEEGRRMFGFRGANGVTAYLERHANKRGLVVYVPGEPPRWVGAQYTGIRTYDGPGLPVLHTFREQFKDWLVYDGQTLLGLDPESTYWFDESLSIKPDRVHLFRVPGDYVGFTNPDKRLYTQEVGPGDSYFYVRFSGHGPVGAHIPERYIAILDGCKLEVDEPTRTVMFEVNAVASMPSSLGDHINLAQDPSLAEPTAAQASGPVELIVFRQQDNQLSGPWIDLPWVGTPDSMKWITPNESNGLSMSIGTVGKIIGKMPAAKNVRILGSYQVGELGPGFPGDGVIRINGVEVARVPHGEVPYPETAFDIDVSGYAGQYVFIEFTPDGPVRAGYASWNNPRFVVDGED